MPRAISLIAAGRPNFIKIDLPLYHALKKQAQFLIQLEHACTWCRASAGAAKDTSANLWPQSSLKYGEGAFPRYISNTENHADDFRCAPRMSEITLRAFRDHVMSSST